MTQRFGTPRAHTDEGTGSRSDDPQLVHAHEIADAAAGLRPLSHSAAQLVAINATDQASNADIADVVSHDQVLAASVLREANSAASAATSEITTVDQAIVRLGMQRVMATALRLSLSSEMSAPVPEYGMSDGELGLLSVTGAIAAEVVRERLPHLTTLAQGDAQLPELAAQFVGDPHTCLFGTLSLWQGLDVPVETCQLVLIDRIPFPRPDDPLLSARQKAADEAGGNGFMQVAATHAALLLAQGAGRLIRTATDRGVVAVIDPRLATARYAGFLRASLPPMWTTTDPAVARQALARLSAG